MGSESDVRALTEKMAQERAQLLAQIEALGDADAARVPLDGEGPSGEGQWSVKQQCAHLAEMESAYRAWIERALAEENPDVGRLRGEPVAIPLEEANERPIADLVAELRQQRERTLGMIARLRPEDYARTASHPMFNTLTVLQWLRSYYRHDRMHQAQIAGRRPEYQPRFAGGREPDQRRTRLQ
jgi:hypothetical protein